MELGFEPREGQSMNQKNFQWHGLLKKNQVRQKNCTLLPKYLSQEGNNMNKKSWNLQHHILTFFKEEEKEEEEDFGSPDFW